MKAGLFSGGAAWGAYLVGKLYKKRPIYDAYIGTSTGALIALFLALGRLDKRFYELLAYEYCNTDNKEMYGFFHPFTKSGSFSKLKMIGAGIIMMRNDRNYLYDITPALRTKITKYFKEEHFNALRKEKIDVIVTRKNADMRRSRTEYVSILSPAMSYERFVDSVVASAAIPFFAKPVIINGFQYVDGGVLDPVPTELFSKYKNVDIYLIHSQQDEQAYSSPSDGWLKLANNLFNDIRYEIKMDDINTVTNADIFYSRKLNWNSANFDKKKMREAFNKGIEDYNNNI